MTFLLSILNTLVPATGLVLAVWLAMRLLRLNAATRYAAWWTVLAVVILMPFTPRWIERTASDPHPVVVSLPPATQAPLTTVEVAEMPMPAAPVERTDWALVLLAGYAVVALALLLRLFVDFLKVRKLISTATPLELPLEAQSIRLLASDSIETPLAAGFWRPAILFPAALAAKLSTEEMRHILVHESAHIARRDQWTNLVGKLLQALCWPHPLVAIILNQIEVEREHACDDWVVASTGQPVSYAKSLARLVEVTIAGKQPVLAASIIGQGPRVSKRVEMLLDKTRNFAPRISVPKLAMSILCLGVFVAICTQAPMMVAMAQQTDEDPQAAPPQPPQPAPAPRPVRAPAPLAAPQPGRPPAPAPFPVPGQQPAPPVPPEAGARPGFLASLAAAGYKDLSVDEIIEMKNHGVDAKFIQDMSENGWGKLSPKDLMNLRANGISGLYLRELKGAGIKGLTLDRAIELRNHGVNAKTITEVHSLGFGPYNESEILEMTRHGLRADFFRSLKENGIQQISAENALEAARHGLTARSIVEARKYGPNLSFEQILKLKRAGVI
jgi:beta-lactamase regulating signal transducer with metallopeptidase domain